MKKKIYIVTHKAYNFPLDEEYCPIQVGNALIENMQSKDSSGDNISHLNSSFCELTALYWIWKNDASDIIGLMHYRRYFKAKKNTILLNGKKIPSPSDFSAVGYDCDIIVHKPRNYYITSIKNHYCKAHYADDFLKLRNEIELQFPEYLDSFDKVMNGRSISLYNMFVSKREVIEPYFFWLFSLLFALEKQIPYTNYDKYQKRVFGFIAERLFNVWLEHNKGSLNIEYRGAVNIEGENLLKKSVGLLKRHLLR